MNLGRRAAAEFLGTALLVADVAYIVAAYWFTASTSFANPAVTLARSLTGSFAGIRPADVPGFTGAQVAGSVLAVAVDRWLYRQPTPSALAFVPPTPGPDPRP